MGRLGSLRQNVFCALVFAALGSCDWVLDRALNRPDQSITLPPPPPSRLAQPEFVLLQGDRVIVEMDDGVQCLGASGVRFSPAGWTGTLTECDYAYSYAVALSAGTPAGDIPLLPVTDPLLPIDEDDVPFRPLASAVVTDTSGRSFRFESVEGF